MESAGGLGGFAQRLVALSHNGGPGDAPLSPKCPACGQGNGYLNGRDGELAGTDPEAQMRRVCDEHVSADHPPASSLVQVVGLVHPQARIAIEAPAVT